MTGESPMKWTEPASNTVWVTSVGLAQQNFPWTFVKTKSRLAPLTMVLLHNKMMKRRYRWLMLYMYIKMKRTTHSCRRCPINRNEVDLGPSPDIPSVWWMPTKTFNRNTYEWFIRNTWNTYQAGRGVTSLYFVAERHIYTQGDSFTVFMNAFFKSLRMTRADWDEPNRINNNAVI